MEGNKKYSLRDIDNISFEDLPNDAVIVLDDRARRYDKKNDRFVRPGDPGYDELPDILR